MMIVTIAEAASRKPRHTVADAPVWQTRRGTRYRVACARMAEAPEGAWMPDSGLPMPKLSTRAAVIIGGMDGRAALAALGLSAVEVDEP